MINAICPHCKEVTVQRVVQQRDFLTLFWCQLCYRVIVDKTGFPAGRPAMADPQLSLDLGDGPADGAAFAGRPLRRDL